MLQDDAPTERLHAKTCTRPLHAMRRSVFVGPIEDLATDLSGIAARRGRSFCQYPDEAPKVSDAKLHIDALAPEHDLLVVLRRHQPN